MNFEKDFLNKKNSIRNLPDEVFLQLLPEMAEQLAQIDYHYFHTNEELIKSWDNLKKYNNKDHYTASQVRAGIELCEHFFPNFYSIRNKDNEDFSMFWTPEKLIKIIRWNRIAHSTPYLSELKRGVYFCYGLTKNTMFRPHLAKMICQYYDAKNILDPCCGWGGRLLGTVAAGAHYYGFEPNTETFSNLNKLVEFLHIEDKVSLFCDGAENMDKYDIPYVDLVLTSPPYYNKEIYCEETTQSITQYSTYKEWLEKWLYVIIDKANNLLSLNGVSGWNVAPKMQQDVENYLLAHNFVYDSDFGLSSSARQANQNAAKNKKTQDATLCYRKVSSN